MRGAAVILLACLLAAATPLRAEETPPDDPCAVPERILTVDATLPRAYERMKRGGSLPILVLNTAKPGPGRAETSYPAVLEKELSARLPDRKVGVTVRNAPGDTAEEMLPALGSALAASAPALVVWQVGTVDAMRNIGPDSFGEAVAAGIAQAHGRGADIVVMDMQYSPQTTQLITFQPYLDYVEWVTQNNDVFHFPRYEMMRYWFEEGRVGFGPDAGEEKLQAFQFVHRCIGRLLAETVTAMLDRAARPAP
ncbi:SGNH/GDSL hydrolase family protein [Azospirillum sp. sgz302134]